MMAQKFFLGDLVMLGGRECPWHDAGCKCGEPRKAIVIHSYAEQYGDSPNGTEEFSLFLFDENQEISWFNAKDMTLIEPDRLDLLPIKSIHRRNYEAKKDRDNSRQCLPFSMVHV